MDKKLLFFAGLFLIIEAVLSIYSYFYMSNWLTEPIAQWGRAIRIGIGIYLLILAK
ncbi:MAG: hypothetical protein AABY22_14190 [Nanoarchaeota archaeon]